MSKELKTGRLSKHEIEMIDSSPDSTDKELALLLNRSEESISNRRASKPQVAENEANAIYIQQLHKKHFWTIVEYSLLPEEAPQFENMWAALMGQFEHQGVTATDEVMMKDVIIEDILLHRALRHKRDILVQIRDFEELIAEKKAIPLDCRTPDDSASMTGWLANIVQLRGAEGEYTKEINEIKKTKDRKFTDLKATRQERLKTVEESGKNVFAMIRVLDEKKARDTEGRMAALVDLAAKKKTSEFESYHEFADGEVDRPFGTPESEIRYAQDAEKEIRRLQQEGESSDDEPGPGTSIRDGEEGDA